MSHRKLTEQEEAICRQLNVAPEDYLATEVAEMEAALCREGENQAERIAELMGISESEAADTFEKEKENVLRRMGVSKADAEKIEAEGKKKAAAQAPLTPAELEACRALGVEPLEYWATKMEEAGLKPAVG